MEKRTIPMPKEYMLIGEVAKKAGVTVRTLQYYDKEGLLSPTAESESGYRLYTDKDMVKLVQILVMKQLGFTLEEIKKRMSSLDSTDDVINALTQQAAEIRKKISLLTKSLNEIEALKSEVTQIDAVDFQKIGAILATLQMQGGNYWIIKHFDSDLIAVASETLSEGKAKELTEAMNRSYSEANQLRLENLTPDSEEVQKFAKEFWEGLMAVMGGDIKLVQKINEQVVKLMGSNTNMDTEFVATHRYIESALQVYFSNLYLGGELID